MKNPLFRNYILIIVFIIVPILFFSESQVSIPEFLIFLFGGIIIGINICKIMNSKNGDN